MYGIYAIWIKNWQIRHSINTIYWDRWPKIWTFLFFRMILKSFWVSAFLQMTNKQQKTMFCPHEFPYAISFAMDLTCWWEVGAGYGAVSATSVAFLVGFENNSRVFSFDRQPVRAVLPTEPGKRKIVKCVHIDPHPHPHRPTPTPTAV